MQEGGKCCKYVRGNSSLRKYNAHDDSCTYSDCVNIPFIHYCIISYRIYSHSINCIAFSFSYAVLHVII